MSSQELQQLIQITKSSSQLSTIEEATEKIANLGYLKCHKTSIESIILSGFLGGCFVSFGGYLSLLTGRNFHVKAEVMENEQNDFVEDLDISGLNNLVAAATFPIGLICIILLHMDVFMGAIPVFALSFLKGKAKWYGIVKVSVLTYVSNLVGVFFISFFLILLVQRYDPNDPEPWQVFVRKASMRKCDLPFYSLFFGGIGGTWLVSIGVILCSLSKQAVGKFLGVWFPIFAFAAIDFNNCMVDAFYIITGLFYGAPKVYWLWLPYNLVFTTLGNICGGSFFVGFTFWYVFRDRGGILDCVTYTFRVCWRKVKGRNDNNSRRKEIIGELEDDDEEEDEMILVGDEENSIQRNIELEETDETTAFIVSRSVDGFSDGKNVEDIQVVEEEEKSTVGEEQEIEIKREEENEIENEIISVKSEKED